MSPSDPYNLTAAWLAEKLKAPEDWSVRDRDDIVWFIEKKRGEIARMPEHREPARAARAQKLAELEAAMERHIESKRR